MIAYSKRRASTAEESMRFIQSQEWGLLILDEVYFPCNKLSVAYSTCQNVPFSSKNSALPLQTRTLTTTLLRKDNKITDLNFLISLKLYEANWTDLQKVKLTSRCSKLQAGHIAKVQCAEVRCPMPGNSYAAYLQAPTARRQRLAVMNQQKFRACKFPIKFHERRRDKVRPSAFDICRLLFSQTT